MRWLVLGIAAVALAGCSKAPGDQNAGVEAAADDTAPGVAVTAAPGVAFAYRYGFRLPAARIAAVQEEHAQACEKLGVTRCRITGMRYRLLGENDIEGELDFRLAPALARAFGRDAGAVVEQAKGRAVAAEITGTDAGATLDRAGTDRARAAAEAARLDTRLAAARGAGRAQLQQQRADVVRRVTAADDGAADARASLATTPMSFRYESGPAVRGFDSSAPLASALDTAIASAQATLAVILAIAAVLGPPALAASTLWLGLRPLVAAWRRRHVPLQEERTPG